MERGTQTGLSMSTPLPRIPGRIPGPLPDLDISPLHANRNEENVENLQVDASGGGDEDLFVTALETPAKAPPPRPLLGATALLAPYQHQLCEARNGEAVFGTGHPSQEETLKIDDVVHGVRSLGIQDFSESSSDSDSDYGAPVPSTRRRPERGGLGDGLGDGLGGRASVDNTIGVLEGVLINMPKAQDADGLGSPGKLTVELYPYQMHGLTWLWFREQHTPHGGILADEAGLGSTVMILALCCRGIAEGEKKDVPKYGRLNGGMLSSRGTLVICPCTVMEQWELDVKNKCGRMNVLKYYGKNRPKDISQIAQHDIIITSYETLRSEVTYLAENAHIVGEESFCPKSIQLVAAVEVASAFSFALRESGVCGSPLIQIHWERIVLDQGHVIRNPKAQTSLAVCRLNARHRWIVTGTPVHNKPLDMFSLIKFLRLEPFDDKAIWKSWIGTKLSSDRDRDRLNTIVKSVMLRRTRDEVSIPGAAGLEVIPAKRVLVIRVTLKPQEKEIYDHLFSFARQELRDYIKSQENRAQKMEEGGNGNGNGRRKRGGIKSNLFILTWLLRLRQCAVLPRLLLIAIDKSENVVGDSGELDRVMDLMSFENPVFSPDFQSAKLDKVYEDLDELKRQCQSRKVPMEKVVIVSQWTSLLDVVQHQLNRKGYTTAILCKGEEKGKERTEKREKIIHEFNQNPNEPQIMLLSLLTDNGGNLTLIGGSHLFILDLHLNPQLELLAHDRLHCVGQTKPVTIHRYITAETLEEFVLNHQKCKLELAWSILGNNPQTDSPVFSMAQVRQIFGL